MDMSMSANFALSSTFIKDRTFYNISEDAVVALCIDPGFVFLDISRRVLEFGIYALLSDSQKTILVFLN